MVEQEINLENKAMNCKKETRNTKKETINMKKETVNMERERNLNMKSMEKETINRLPIRIEYFIKVEKERTFLSEE
jgi:hypothetical protein